MERSTVEPGQPGVEFRARHMMVMWARGSFMRADLDDPMSAELEVTTGGEPPTEDPEAGGDPQAAGLEGR